MKMDEHQSWRTLGVLGLLTYAFLACSSDSTVPSTTQGAQIGGPCSAAAACAAGVCDLGLGECVECTADSHCGNGQLCMGYDCAPWVTCTGNAQCSGLLCDPFENRCVECFEAGHCSAIAPTCLRGACVSTAGGGESDSSSGDPDSHAPDASKTDASSADEGGADPDSGGGVDAGGDAEVGEPDGDSGSEGASDGDGGGGDDSTSPTECIGNADCSDGNPCTKDRCIEGECFNSALSGEPCEDPDPCRIGGECSVGKCIGSPIECNDGNHCTSDFCEEGEGCVYGPLTGLACDDGNDCTENDFCQSGACKGAGPECNDGNPCTTDNCDGLGGCAYTKLSGAPCDDKNKCTFDDQCTNGACLGEMKPCADANPCTIDGCNAAGQCTHSPISGECDDSDPCTANDVCYLGECDGDAANCNDGNPCTTDSCETGVGCQHKKLNVVSCSDGDPCTDQDACQFGLCLGVPKDCQDDNPCTEDACNSGGVCTHKGLTASPGDPACSDGDECTTQDHCELGTCLGAAKDCAEDENPCTSDACNPVTGNCEYAFVPATCSDGQDCTQFDSCKLIDGTPTCGGTAKPNNAACYTPGGVLGKCQTGVCTP